MAVSISGSWAQLASHQIWTYGGRCNMYFQVFAYCTQDVVNNKSTVHTRARICIQNLNTGYTGYSVTQTWATGLTGASNTSWYGTIADGGKGATTEHVLSDGSFTVSHDSNGNASSKVYYWFNGSSTGKIDYSNTGVEIKLPTIDRGGGAAGASVSSHTYNSGTLTLTSNVNTSLGRYKFGSGSWNEFSTSNTDLNKTGGGSISKTFGGLSPNTSYTITVQFRRDWNQVWGSTASATFTTDKPTAPSGGSVSVSSKTYNSINISWSGFSAGSGASISKYAYKNGSGDWSYTTGTSATFSSLSPNTSYTLYVCAIDNYGTWSGAKGVTTTTNKPNAPTAGKVTVSNITPFGATFSWSGFAFGSGAGWGKYQYSWQDTGWYDCGQSTSITLSNRSPNTSNTFYVRLVDNYGTASSNVTVTFTTSKPNAPTAGKCSVSNISCYSATVSWSGFSFGSGATWGKYQYKLGNGSWTDYSQNTVVNLSNLSANTSYTCYARLVDNYGTVSNTASVTFTTQSEDSWKFAPLYIKTDNTWKYGIVYYKVNGKWQKITGAYYK